MTDLDSQTAFWDAASTTKTFTHPIHLPWLDGVSRDAKILDYGCGYGRLMGVLEGHGFVNLAGVDTSPAMIARARTLHPALNFSVLTTPPTLPDLEASVDVALLFAVLTCIPGDDAQLRLASELARVLKPGGLLYISDVPLQDGLRNRNRYASFESYGTYGVFETGDGAVCRHHTNEWFSLLLADFERTDTRHITVTTMNGNQDKAIQILVRKPAMKHNDTAG